MIVSVIVPCYNGAKFIIETLDSILQQKGVEFEVILVDDGSVDRTGELVKKIKDSRIIYCYQENKGVSAARNYGLKLARGKFVIFFDADDKMPAGFIQSRLQPLLDNPLVGFSCGPVITFPQNSRITYGVAASVPEALLTYDPLYSSCPSNYLVRKKVLSQANVKFNELLSSTADRFFLIQLANVTIGKFINGVPLLYRIDPASMSNNITRRLFEDNELYCQELIKKGMIPELVKAEFLFRINRILGLGYVRTGAIFVGCKYLLKAFCKKPFRFTKDFSRIFIRYLSF